MSPTDIRLERSYRTEVTYKSAAATRERTDRTHALIVMALSLACTAMAMIDLALLAAGH